MNTENQGKVFFNKQLKHCEEYQAKQKKKKKKFSWTILYERGFFFFFKWNNYFVQVILNTFAQMFSFETKTRHCDDFGSSGVYNLYQRARGFESPVHGQEKELCPKNLMKKKKKRWGWKLQNDHICINLVSVPN